MQFLAFLKDSYREASSGWVLQIMLGLGALLLLVVASIGLRSVTMADHLSEQLRMMTKYMGMSPEYGQFGSPQFSIENVEASNQAEPWKSDYTFDFVVTSPTPADLRKAVSRETGLPTTRDAVQHFLHDALRKYEKVKVKDPQGETARYAAAGAMLAAEPPLTSNQLRYPVTVSGSTVDDPLAWTHRVSVLFAWDMPLFDTSLREAVFFIEKWVINKIGGWVLLFIGVIVTAGFIPNMLAKGSLDLLLAKPIGRSRLLVYKYVGGLSFVVVLTLITILGFWVIIGLRSGIWTSNFLATIPILTFYFAILYAVSALTSMLTRNALVSILITILAWGLFWGIGKVNDGIENRREAEVAAAEKKNPFVIQPDDGTMPSDNPLARFDPDAPLWGVIPKYTFPIFTTIQAISPRTYQIDDRLSRLIAEGALSPNQLKKEGYAKPPRESWVEMIGVSLVFIAVMLGLSCWRFQTRDC